jgi:hypothetical protein
MGHQDEDRRAQMRMRWEKMADEIGLERPVDVSDLIYNDPHRADVVEWLDAHGWNATGEKSTDEMGKLLYNPSMPGKSLTQGLPYFFDEVLALRVERDADGNSQRAIMCDSDGLWLAKDRSGKLDAWESPDLGDIIRKIGGVS